MYHQHISSQIKNKYISSEKLINEIPDIPVECKHIRSEILLNDFETFETIQMEEGIQLGLTETTTYGMNLDLSLPETNYVPNIEDNDTLPGDDILFGFEKRKHVVKEEEQSDNDIFNTFDQVGVIQQSHEIESAFEHQTYKNITVEHLIPKQK